MTRCTHVELSPVSLACGLVMDVGLAAASAAHIAEAKRLCVWRAICEIAEKCPPRDEEHGDG